MTELNWTLSWTLMTVGVCWLLISCAAALALGRIIQRSKAGAAVSPESIDGQADGFIDGEDNRIEFDEGGSRAASGTRLKAIRFEQEDVAEERKVS
jgi:hypothetical protein